MSIQLPNPGYVFLPEVPSSVDPKTGEYLSRLRLELQKALRGQFDNSNLIATSINSGVSGSFATTTGKSIVFVNGICVGTT